MPTDTPRLDLAQPLGSDAVSELRLAITQNATVLDAAVLVTQGTLSSRPAATAVAPSSEYRATDTGQWFKSTGTVWVPLQVGYPARGYFGTGTTVPAGGWSEFLVDTVTFDPGSCFSAGAYVCPFAGYYAVSGQTAILSATVGFTGYVSTGILKNPTGSNPVSSTFAVSQGSTMAITTASEVSYTNVSDIIQCAQGDKLVLGCFSTATQNITTAPTVNYLAVHPVLG